MPVLEFLTELPRPFHQCQRPDGSCLLAQRVTPLPELSGSFTEKGCVCLLSGMGGPYRAEADITGQFHKTARPLEGSVGSSCPTQSINSLSHPRGTFSVLRAEARLSLSCLLSGCTGGKDIAQDLLQPLPQDPVPVLFHSPCSL